MGVAPLEKKQSIIVYNGKDHYNEWEFVYDPRMEQMNVLAGVQVQGPAGSLQQQVQPNQNQPQAPNPAGMPNQVPQ